MRSKYFLKFKPRPFFSPKFSNFHKSLIAMGKRKKTKRKNAKNKSSARGEGGATKSNSYDGGGGSKNDKYSAFEFSEDDMRVDIESRKTLAKFGTKSPNKKPVDGYAFLGCFAAQGQQKDSGNDISRCHISGKKHNKILYLYSDEDCKMESRSLSSFNLGENEGSIKNRSSEYGGDSNDCGAVVAVAPYYVKYGKIYYTQCRLTFSQKSIRLEGSSLCDIKRTHSLEWSTFDVLKIECQQCESVEVVNLHMKSKCPNIGETGDSDSDGGELEFVIPLNDPQWSKKQEEIKSLDLKFKAAWITTVSECSFKESFENLVYPEGDPDAVFISRRDFELLQPGTFINDTIIDFYMKYLSNKIKPEERHRYHFFNTFFFQKLNAVHRDSSRAWEGGNAFQSVRKWTRNVNIFETDYIFIPVNFSLHWSLIIISHPGKVASLRDKVMDESPKVPCILHMDSIRGSHGGFENLIRCYLWEEWKERGNKHEEDISKKFLNLKFVSLQLPQQENWFDCGLFLLHYAELFLEQATNFSTTEFFDILDMDWFHPAEVSLTKRDHIRRVIHRIVEDNALKDPPAARNNKYLQSLCVDEGDNSVNFILKNSVIESCSGVKFNSSGDHYMKGQRYSTPMLDQRSSTGSATDECFQPYKLLPPINQFSNLSLPMEDAFENHTTSRRGDVTRKCHIDTPMPPCCRLSSDFRTGKMKGSLNTSKTSSDNSLIIIDVQNEEDCCPEVAFPIERHKDRYDDNSSLSSEDLAARVVEDSEDESGIESTRRTRQYSLVNSPICFNI